MPSAPALQFLLLTFAGITSQPGEAWMRNMARHLTDGFDGFLLGKRHLVFDRDPLFTKGFRIVPLGERHLRYAVKEYVEHYHRERHHQSLDSSIITPEDRSIGDGPVQRRERLGGILNHYYREAA